MQDEKGAAYIDVNVGPRPAEFMAEMVAKIQGVTARPLSIDTPDPRAGRGRPEGIQSRPRRRPKADHQFHLRLAG